MPIYFKLVSRSRNRLGVRNHRKLNAGTNFYLVFSTFFNNFSKFSTQISHNLTTPIKENKGRLRAFLEIFKIFNIVNPITSQMIYDGKITVFSYILSFSIFLQLSLYDPKFVFNYQWYSPEKSATVAKSNVKQYKKPTNKTTNKKCKGSHFTHNGVFVKKNPTLENIREHILKLQEKHKIIGQEICIARCQIIEIAHKNQK